MDYAEILKSFRKKPIAVPADFTDQLDYDRSAIQRIIPHRDPFLLLDRLTGLNLDEGILAASRLISEKDPVFAGHFPGCPVYPGSLQLEMIGQAGLCLTYFVNAASAAIAADAQPVRVRATKILGAQYLQPVPPASAATLIVKKLAHETYFGTVVGQVLLGATVCCVAICEVCFLD